MKASILLLASLSLASLVFVGCSSGLPPPTPIAGSERDAVLAYADAKTDGLLAGLNAGDYAAYSRDFDPTMRQALGESVFSQNRQLVIGRIGRYVGRQVDRVERIGPYIAVNYAARFEQEGGVTVRVVFNESDHSIAGLFFTSPKLRE